MYGRISVPIQVCLTVDEVMVGEGRGLSVVGMAGVRTQIVTGSLKANNTRKNNLTHIPSAFCK